MAEEQVNIVFDWKMHQQHFFSEINDSFELKIHMLTSDCITNTNNLSERLFNV